MFLQIFDEFQHVSPIVQHISNISACFSIRTEICSKTEKSFVTTLVHFPPIWVGTRYATSARRRRTRSTFIQRDASVFHAIKPNRKSSQSPMGTFMRG